MKKLNATLLVLAVVFLFASCATPNLKADKASQLQAKSFSPKAGLSNIYVYRPTNFGGGAVDYSITIDKQHAGDLENGFFALIEIPPGKHAVSTSAIERSDVAGDVILLDTKAGNNYFLLHETGFFGVELHQVDEAIGKREVAKYSMAAVPESVIKAREKSAQEQREATEQANFEKAVEIYRNTKPKPVLSEEGRKYNVQAVAAFKDKQFSEAAEHYAQALKVAPWWPDGHFNRALILGELKRFGEAVREMNRYLQLVPDATNARAAQDKIYEWERFAPKETLNKSAPPDILEEHRHSK
jgi:tetratricopeptide (TPR) repeat protein